MSEQRANPSQQTSPAINHESDVTRHRHPELSAAESLNNTQSAPRKTPELDEDTPDARQHRHLTLPIAESLDNLHLGSSPTPTLNKNEILPYVFLAAILSALGFSLINGIILYSMRPMEVPAIVLHPPPSPAPTATSLPTATPAPITVFLSGAVKSPQNYTLPAGSRVGDLLAIAGGLLAEADIAQVNQAQLLVDGVQVHVPFPVPTDAEIISSQPPAGVSGGTQLLNNVGSASNTSGVDGRINLNTATLEELMTLSGIGKTKAESIIASRPYASVDELDKANGVGAKTVDSLRDLVTVE
ncbi:ComEA family DNA-binding protein [Chloroflexi bacterium TSY]|nr:ComEA family DNA-binding protein [Chloroflexi bacterium TSY]